MKKMILGLCMAIGCASSIQAMTPDERVQKVLHNLEVKGESILSMPDAFFAYVQAKASQAVQDEVNALVIQAMTPITQKDEKKMSLRERANMLWNKGKAQAKVAQQWLKDNPKTAGVIGATGLAVTGAGAAYYLNRNKNAQEESGLGVGVRAQALRADAQSLEQRVTQLNNMIKGVSVVNDTNSEQVRELYDERIALQGQIRELREEADRLEQEAAAAQ